jgi:hypothetical protein
MPLKRSIQIVILIALCMMSCKEQVQTPAGLSDDALVSLICASPQLISDMGGNGESYVLLDNTDTAYPPVKPDITNQPVFQAYTKYMYPTTAFNETLPVPWSDYMHLTPGKHTFTLLDTGRLFRAVDQSQLGANQPVSIFYTDSLGHFRSIVLLDQATTPGNQVGLRFLHLSPDAGSIFFTIDEIPASMQGFDSAYLYGQASSFINYGNLTSDTLRINFFQAGDSVDVIVREFLPVNPGHAYTFALQGYNNPSPQYTDPLTGILKTPVGGLSVLAYQNN